MRIGVDARTFFQRTGVGRTTRHLLSQLAASDTQNEYVVFISNHHRADEFPFKTANTQVVVSRADWMSGPAEMTALASEALRYRLDLMYFLFQLPSRFPVPFIIKVYDIIPLLFPEWHVSSIVELFRRQLAPSCRAASAIITPSLNTARDIENFVAADYSKVHVVPEAVELVPEFGGIARFQNPNSEVRNRFALFVGTLEPRKNVQLLLRLWQKYAGDLAQLRLVIAGKEGWDLEACRQVKAGIPGVDYLGFVTDSELADLYAKATCLVYPSLYEGFGMPIVEAMAAKCPVITTPCGSLAEVARNAAIVLDPNDEAGWVEALSRLASDPECRRSYVNRGLSHAAQFTVERHVEGTLRVLERMFDGVSV